MPLNKCDAYTIQRERNGVLYAITRRYWLMASKPNTLPECIAVLMPSGCFHCTVMESCIRILLFLQIWKKNFIQN